MATIIGYLYNSDIGVFTPIYESVPDKVEDINDYEGYLVEDFVYFYKGEITDDSTEPALYLQDGEFVIIPYEDGDMTFHKSNISKNDANDLISKITVAENIDNETSDEENEDEKSKKKKTRKSSSKDKTTKKRISRHEKLCYEINDDDIILVRLIKERINEKGITSAYIYEKVGSDGEGFNLTYGLSIRPNMSWKIFERWCEILDLDWDLTIKDI